MRNEHPGCVVCPQCATFQIVTESSAFGGRDKLRQTLSCGHVVSK